MAKSTKFLVATDSRFSLTIALDQAFATGKISPEVLATRKKELVDLVSEAAKTFGFQSKTTLTNAFDMSVGLLSLALVSATTCSIPTKIPVCSGTSSVILSGPVTSISNGPGTQPLSATGTSVIASRRSTHSSGI